MSKLIGRKEIQLNINDLKDERIPIYDSTRGLWTTIDKDSLISSASVGSIQLSDISGSTFANRDYLFPQNLTVSGSLTAQTLVVSSSVVLSSSIIYDSGSTKFGDSIDDIHQFTGSLYVDGDITTNKNITGSVVTSNEFKLNAGSVSLTFTGSVSTGIFGATEYVYPFIPTSSYVAATVEYAASRPGGTRVGVLLASWIGDTVVVTDVSSTDVGDTSDISFSLIQNGGYMKFRVESLGSGSYPWTVQSLFKLFPVLP